jgi:UDP-glucose 4-epimerase
MRVLVTGATGFIGSHVAVALARAGHTVTATGRDPGKLPALARVPGIRLERLDLGERGGWARQLEGQDALVHVALGWGDQGPSMLEADTAASVALFEACVAAKVPKVLYTSSTAANGEMEALNSEQRQPRPIDFYGATKAATEMFARAYARRHGLKMQVIRPGYIFGEPVVEGARSQPDGRFRQIVAAIRSGEPVRLVQHDGTQFLHADDIALAYVRLLDHPAEFSIHYALSDQWRSWEEVARWAMEAAGREVPVELEDKGYGAEPYRFDVTALERDFGLRFSNEARLKAHVAWEWQRTL